MCGRAAFTTSPSVRSSIRSTPWVDGCCGPMFRIISSVSMSASGSQSWLPLSIRVWVDMALVLVDVRVGRREIERADADLFAGHGPFGHLRGRPHAHAVVELGVDPVLAQRMAGPVVGQQD